MNRIASALYPSYEYRKRPTSKISTTLPSLRNAISEIGLVFLRPLSKSSLRLIIDMSNHLVSHKPDGPSVM